MTKFFYPASRAHHAHSMAIDFGMKFQMRNGFWSLEGLAGMDRAGSYQIMIAEESVHLLEPQVGDLVGHRGMTGIFDHCGQIAVVSECHSTVCYNLRNDDFSVIQRNGTAFHMPEREESVA